MKKILAKIGRNTPCPCGSGKKYKRCCGSGRKGRPFDVAQHYLHQYNIRLKTPEQVEGIRTAGRLALATLDLVEENLRPGMTTDEINTLVHDFTIANNAIPAPLNYRNSYPKSVCVSVNEVICHGIPGDRVIKEGDIVNVDVTPILNGFYADANKTFIVGQASTEAHKITAVARECLRLSMAMVKPGNTIGDIGWAIQQYAEENDCSVVREFVGHGVGIDFHEAPQVPHFGKKGEGIPLVPQMVFTIEPMINLGGARLRILDDDWTAVTLDGSLSAQFEQTVLVTETGMESLTPFPLQ